MQTASMMSSHWLGKLCCAVRERNQSSLCDFQTVCCVSPLTAGFLGLVRAIGTLWFSVASPASRDTLAIQAGKLRRGARLLGCMKGTQRGMKMKKKNNKREDGGERPRAPSPSSSSWHRSSFTVSWTLSDSNHPSHQRRVSSFCSSRPLFANILH